jgi:O-glycosyl hydrolase
VGAQKTALETEEVSLRVARAILSDPGATPYVVAIGYHSYPYSEGYSSASFILSTSGAGKPDTGRVAVPDQLRDLGDEYHVNVWMTENSHGGRRSYNTVRARVVQIHDEFLYANASAYFGEEAMWDLTSQRLHFKNNDLYGDSEGNIVLINNDTGAVDITGIGYAIRHYARWVRPGAVRVDATSSDPPAQVSAFRDDSWGTVALVLINNAATPKSVSINFTGLSVTGNWTGEQSTVSGYWKPFAAASATPFTIILPETSVTSIGGRL